MSITQGEITIVSESTNQIVVGINSYDPNSPRHDIWRMEGTQGVPRDGGVRVAKDIDPTQNFVDNTVEPDRDYRYQLSSHGEQLITPSEPAMNILLDTDLATDSDDGAALYILMNAHDKGDCNLRCVVINNKGDYSSGAAESMLYHFGLTDIPVGAYKGNDVGVDAAQFYEDIATDTQEYGHTRTTRDQFPDAVDVYRQTLASLPSDAENVIVSIGHLNNIYYLLESEPDQHSDLNGLDLVKEKVSRFEIMGGRYPTGHEHNFTERGADAYTQNVIHNLRDNTNIELRLVGWDLGRAIETGSGYDVLPETHPLRRNLVGHRGEIMDHYSYDSCSAFSAVYESQDRGLWFEWVRGTLTVGTSGYSSFSADPNEGDHYYADLYDEGQGPSVEEIENEIESLQLGEYTS